jgi:hypothetical protein
MKNKYQNLLWGLALIAAGGVLFAQNFGILPFHSPVVWIIVFSGLSLVFLASYFLSGLNQWGLLFPSLIFGALAVTIGLSEAGVRDSIVGAPILASVAVPFIVAYGIAPRKNWWALIPAWVMTVLTVVVILADRVQGEWIGTLVLLSIAVPFLVVYLTDRTRWWALIPGLILFVVGLIPILTLRFEGESMGSLVMFLFAVPFILVYFLVRSAWWALIPAGVMATIGVVVLVAQNVSQNAGMVSAILFFGWALTFLILWLRRAVQPTEWAKYPAAVLAVLGAVTLVLGVLSLPYVWPIAIILIGAALLVTSLIRKTV